MELATDQESAFLLDVMYGHLVHAVACLLEAWSVQCTSGDHLLSSSFNEDVDDVRTANVNSFAGN